MNHSKYPESDYKANAKCWINNPSKMLEPLDLLLLLLVPLVTVKLPQGSLLNFFINTDQSKQEKAI